MRQDSQTVGPDITVDRVVRDYMYRLNRKFVVVADGEHAIGYIGPEQIRKIHQSDWPDTYARAAAARFTHETAVSPQTSAIEALRKLQSNGIGYAAVLEGNRPIGVLSETDFINYLSVREELARPPAARGDRKPLRR